MNHSSIPVKLKFVLGLDSGFRPAAVENRAFLSAVRQSGKGVPLVIALERGDGNISTYETEVFGEGSKASEDNYFYVERLVKTLLWIRGAWKITIGGPKSIGEYIKRAYAPGGLRAFDADLMERVYEKQFTVEITDIDKVPCSNERPKPLGGHLKGCRIGFDAGGSDRKVAAIIDGKTVYSEEVIWYPKIHSDPDYHYNEILTAMKTAKSHMPGVDAIGVSAAGTYVNNRVMVASLFIKIPDILFKEKVKDMFLNIQKELGGVPMAIANDGDVAALAGAMDLNDVKVLGISMGTSQAGGYIDKNRFITGWMNELAFIPVDYNSEAMTDEWSGDFGCGVKYFSQDAVIKLASAAGIPLDDKLSQAEKLKAVQGLLAEGDTRAQEIFRTIGCYLGYTIRHYSDFYDIRHLLILGRVTSGEGGNIILEMAEKVLKEEFPELANKIILHLPEESNRRVGQAIAAASLPEIE